MFLLDWLSSKGRANGRQVLFEGLPHLAGGGGFTPVNLNLWPPIQHESDSRDVLVGGGGSVANLLVRFYEATAIRRLSGTSVYDIAAAVTTDEDGKGLSNLPGDLYYLSEGKGRNPSRHWPRPKLPHVRCRTLGRGRVNGMGSDVMKAVRVLTSNMSFRMDADEVAKDIAASFHRHRKVAAKYLWVRGYGGSDPVSKYILGKTMAKLPPTDLVYLDIVPAPGELLSDIYARGEIYRRVQAGCAENQLTIVVQNSKRGYHEGTDEALVDGLVTLLASAPDAAEMDAASMINTLRHCSCGWVEALPVALDVPLAMGLERYRSWRNHNKDQWLNVRLTQEEGDQSLEIILDRVEALLVKNPQALHLLVIAGFFANDHEVAYLKALIQDKARIIGARAIPVVNHMAYPPDEGSMLRYEICDFVAARQLPPALLSPYLAGKLEFSRDDSLTPEAFLDAFHPGDAELELAQEAHRRVLQLL